MKQSIQAEAEKAAKKIREALEEFNRVTGFAADVDARWAEFHQLGNAHSQTLVDSVTLRIDGVEVRA